jgi:hypothetical protein
MDRLVGVSRKRSRVGDLRSRHTPCASYFPGCERLRIRKSLCADFQRAARRRRSGAGGLCIYARLYTRLAWPIQA